MRTQARGLALAVADRVIEKQISSGWFGLPAMPRPGELPAIFAPPYPDLLVTCGRRSAWLAGWLKRDGADRMVAVHVQDPRAPLYSFDLVIAMDHDRIAAGRKVIKVATALHDLTPEKLAAAADVWRPRLACLGRPLAGVLIGGTTRRGAFSASDIGRLVQGLARLRGAGVALAITPSRRTPERLLRRLRDSVASDAMTYLWDQAGENPYRGILTLADRLVVTGDSVSMISEALATGSPTEVFDLNMPHFSQFIDPLIADGALRAFTGDPASPPARGPVDAAPLAAESVRRLLQSRREVATG
ncbi:MAG: mitochondrial fission ELM1 family protein [Caulobacteraceae bacterium]